MFVKTDPDGNLVFNPSGEPFGPIAALLGTVDEFGVGEAMLWNDEITENPEVGSTEIVDDPPVS